jgi:2-oxoglutarate dehydrogenase E1 component
MAIDATTIQVTLPAMGESVTEGTVLEWHKAEGDTIAIDETLVEISTDKVDAEVPSPAAGTVVKIFFAEGDTVEVGAVLAEIAPGDAAAPVAPDSNGHGDAPAPEPAAPDAPAEIVDVEIPSMGESITEGVLLEWSVAVGAQVAMDDPIAEVSTDKVDAELPSPVAGTVVELIGEPGDTVTVGQVVARLAAGEAAVSRPADGNGAAPAAAPSGNGSSGSAPVAAAPEGTKVSPVAARVAAAEGVALGGVAGTGSAGRITKSDVLAAKANGGSNGTAASNGTVIKGAAAMLARYMDESREIPTATSFRTLTVTTMDGRRKQLKEAGHKVSFTHLIAYAIGLAATDDMPVMAHHFDTIDGKPTRFDDGQVNLGIAVDVEKKDGSRTLMVPVIRDVGRQTFPEFLAAFGDLIDRARTNKLTADDLAGGNVSLTNPGGIGTVASVPRLMNGQGTIIATGSIAYPVGLGNIGAAIGAEKVMSMTSTYDHRIIQGAESGRFLKVIEEYLQGEHGFYEKVFGDLGATLGPAPQPPAAQLPAPSALAEPAAAQATPTGPPDEALLQAVQAASSLLKAHRTHGHLAANLDPLGHPPIGDPALDPEPLNLTPELMAQIPAKILRMGVPGATLAEALPHLREVYSGTIAYEIEHISNHEQRVWLRKAIEKGEYRQPLTDDEQKALLKRLVEVDAFERFMHKAYLGQQQFSIEGLDMTVPMIDEAIQLAAGQGAKEVVIGMAHRGRLNVLAHNLGRRYETIFAEFEGKSTLDAVTTIPQGGTGDVKYHHGAQGSYAVADGSTVLVNLESNPSHLEFVHPVVLGATRAAQTTRDQPQATRNTDAAVPIILHGDAAFPGQGVVAESLNLQALDGYKVGGALHLIQNNQVGFTTDPEDARSTRWASDLAKGFDVPIVHVNADDVAACVSAVRLAFAFREEFGHDVVIDLIGYRRYGHNENDEPAYTQPEMATLIKTKPRLVDLYADQLVTTGIISKAEDEQQRQGIWDELTRLHQELKQRIKDAADAGQVEQPTGEYQLDRTASTPVTTAVPAETLLRLNEELLTTPEGFTVNPKLARQLERRRKALGEEGGIDWGHAETLAFASLITEGVPVRLTGQDAERGTFSHRHMVLHDSITGQTVSPIQSLPEARATLELHNSPLSETACLGFEYGYSQEAPDALVLWEAQYGDFANGAQVIIDQFVVSGLAKWGQSSRLTMLLPHGYEGSGPEHSSARLERFLQLAAEGNIRVANLTTPAQYFHLLRRQALIAKQRPLIVMTPKSLLRLPQATNRIQHLSDTQFYPVLGEPRVDVDKVTRLLLCTGKIYYDLVGNVAREGNEGVAVGRVEQLYPFPETPLLELIEQYPNLQEILWVQEEPRNGGARAHMMPRIQQITPDAIHLGYVGRPERASPGEGYPAAHAAEQARILRTALDLSIPVSQYPKKTPGER